MYTFNSPEFGNDLCNLPEVILEMAQEFDPTMDEALLRSAIQELLNTSFGDYDELSV